FHWEVYYDERHKKNAQRNIGNFESVFKLNEVIEDFWANPDLDLKEKFFPIKLWWEISTIIPIRTTELIVTPYDCIDSRNNNYFLTVRRTQLKGSYDKKVKHNVLSDYRLQEVKITKELYELIDEYRTMVD